MSGPLYTTGYTEHGEQLIGGLFRMKDQEGFPLDMAYEICKERRACPDWCEAMADALSQSYTKYETVISEMEMLLGGPLCGEVVKKFEELLCLVWSDLGDKSFESIQVAAGKILQMKKANAVT